MASKRGNQRNVVITAVVALAFATLITLWWGVPTYRKAKADAMLKQLCAKDGGVKVYETVTLPPGRFTRFGEIPISNKSYANTNAEFYYTDDTTWLMPEPKDIGQLTAWRVHQKLLRVRDQQVLAESVHYSRSGGDPIGPWHPSSFGCPKHSDIKDAAKRVFIKG